MASISAASASASAIARRFPLCPVRSYTFIRHSPNVDNPRVQAVSTIFRRRLAALPALPNPQEPLTFDPKAAVPLFGWGDNVPVPYGDLKPRTVGPCLTSEDTDASCTPHESLVTKFLTLMYRREIALDQRRCQHLEFLKFLESLRAVIATLADQEALPPSDYCRARNFCLISERDFRFLNIFLRSIVEYDFETNHALFIDIAFAGLMYLDDMRLTELIACLRSDKRGTLLQECMVDGCDNVRNSAIVLKHLYWAHPSHATPDLELRAWAYAEEANEALRQADEEQNLADELTELIADLNENLIHNYEKELELDLELKAMGEQRFLHIFYAHKCC